MSSEIYNPSSTYRIQFHQGFTFKDVEKIIPYLATLGIKTLYAAPIFEAVSGSNHGYDVTNPLRINPEIGTYEALKDIIQRLKDQGIGWLQDIVPNHMAYHPQNEWLMSVLEKGPTAPESTLFDIHWAAADFQGRLMAPFLGKTYKEALASGEIQVVNENGRWYAKYGSISLPLNTTTLTDQQLPDFDQNGMEGLRARVNANKKTLDDILQSQYFALESYLLANERINYRRFFTVNGLICLNMQLPSTFERYHALIDQCIKENLFLGLRVDHVDGLNDPAHYLDRLRDLSGPQTYIVVEKILQSDERLSSEWPVQGTTGYDFLSIVNNLFTLSSTAEKFDRFYAACGVREFDIRRLTREKKSAFLARYMGGELNNLYNLLMDTNLVHRNAVEESTLKSALAQFLVFCPVYRYYADHLPLPMPELGSMASMLQEIDTAYPQLKEGVEVLRVVLLGNTSDKSYLERASTFYRRLMQFTGPLMAKGLEDTLMYTFNRFIGHNEVGDNPGNFGISIAAFHDWMVTRERDFPLSMNATSTHDTKRGEDIRMRLNVLTELADEWLALARLWMDKKTDPLDDNDAYFIAQTVIGAYPMPGATLEDFQERITVYVKKALKEAKTHTHYDAPNTDYEEQAVRFASLLIDEASDQEGAFKPFHEKVCDYGILNSLGQLIIKFTAPGIPDIYQGCELWDLSLVDPDNRRPVGFALREAFLRDIELENTAESPWESLWRTRYQGKIKLWLTQRMTSIRNNDPDVFSKGLYLPLVTEGKFKDHVLVYTRRYGRVWYMTAMALHLSTLKMGEPLRSLSHPWEDTAILLPEDLPDEGVSAISGVEITPMIAQLNGSRKIFLKELFADIPCDVVRFEQPINERGSGVLMHITSLPSNFGIGDFGKEAFHFADLLAKSYQKYWQILPLCITSEEAGHSPYNSPASMAGNPLLIDLQSLTEMGLLTHTELTVLHAHPSSHIHFADVTARKATLLSRAFNRFKTGSFPSLQRQLSAFIDTETAWLDDFCLYMALKSAFNGAPWYEWPDPFKWHDPLALSAFAVNATAKLEALQFEQFLFDLQWKKLKKYCHAKGISIIGDLPFYVGHDSVDVWKNQDLFSLDEFGRMKGVAGVPPDYFNANGQLWGMPVYRWNKLQETGYSWWLTRIKRNLVQCDLLRLDHFRAFSAFWEVPAGAATAAHGVWKPGPGANLFAKIQESVKKLPFIAEDLGKIDEDVIDLLAHLNIPGMRVLQFAFFDNMAASAHIPHNHRRNSVVYTGTHDNNTTRGWFMEDMDDAGKSRLARYWHNRVNAEQVHLLLSEMAQASVARIAIRPIQDVCGLGAESRMNTPSTVKGNWDWRVLPDQITPTAFSFLKEITKLYNRQ